MKVLIGWLAPNGQFHECKYGEHHKLAQSIYEAHQERMEQLRNKMLKTLSHVPKQVVMKELGYIPFGRTSFGMGYIFFDHIEALTREQAYWFFYNQHRLSPEQRETWEAYREKFGIKEMAS